MASTFHLLPASITFAARQGESCFSSPVVGSLPHHVSNAGAGITYEIGRWSRTSALDRCGLHAIERELFVAVVPMAVIRDGGAIARRHGNAWCSDDPRAIIRRNRWLAPPRRRSGVRAKAICCDKSSVTVGGEPARSDRAFGNASVSGAFVLDDHKA